MPRPERETEEGIDDADEAFPLENGVLLSVRCPLSGEMVHQGSVAPEDFLPGRAIAGAGAPYEAF